MPHGHLPQALHPLRLGMTRSEIESVLHGHEECLLLVSPAQASPGGGGMLANGVECVYACVDDTVVYIAMGDPNVRVNGIGAGSTLTEIETAMRRKCDIVPMQGYGILVELSPTTWCVFPWHDGPIKEGDRVLWIEFRAERDAP